MEIKNKAKMFIEKAIKVYQACNTHDEIVYRQAIDYITLSFNSGII